MLKGRLEKMVPENDYKAGAIADLENIYQGHDVILTFSDLKPFVEKVVGDSGMTVKTIEDFNAFAKGLFNEFLQG